METIDDYAPLVAALKGARHEGVLTGAGVSTLSGIPDFRGPKGLYANPDAVSRFRVVPAGARTNRISHSSAKRCPKRRS